MRLIAILVVLVAALTLFWFSQGEGPARVVLTDVVAIPAAGEEGTVAVYLTLENQGPPLSLHAVSSAEAARAGLMGGAAPLAIPGTSSASFAADGAHLVLNGVSGTPDDGRLLPLLLDFGAQGTVTARARITPIKSAGSGMHGAGELIDLPAGTGPTLALSVAQVGANATLRLETDRFDFVDHGGMGPHVPGEGHAHVYLNGLKLMRLYQTMTSIGPLPPGRHEVSVALNTNDHRAYASAGVPVRASQTIETD